MFPALTGELTGLGLSLNLLLILQEAASTASLT